MGPAPTMEPTAAEVACADDVAWRFKSDGQGCAWTEGKTWRCSRTEGDVMGGRTGVEACPVACGTCPDLLT
jgi:hypothetical protein